MITVAELIRLIRFKQKDNNEIKFSDYDIIQAPIVSKKYFSVRGD